MDNDGAFDIEVTRTIEIENSEAQYGGQFRWVNEPINFCFMVNIPSSSMIEFGDEINGNANILSGNPSSTTLEGLEWHMKITIGHRAYSPNTLDLTTCQIKVLSMVGLGSNTLN